MLMIVVPKCREHAVLNPNHRILVLCCQLNVVILQVLFEEEEEMTSK